MPGIYSNENVWYNSQNKFHPIKKQNEGSIYSSNRSLHNTEKRKTLRSQNRPEIYGTNRSTYSNINDYNSSVNSNSRFQSRSHSDLLTPDRPRQQPSRPVSRAMLPLIQADPELKDAEKAGKDYHITLNLPANLLIGGMRNEGYESTTMMAVEERSNVEEVPQNGWSYDESLDDNALATLTLNRGYHSNQPPQKSVVNIKSDEPLRIITRQEKREVLNVVPPPPPAPLSAVPKSAVLNKVVKTATINVAGGAKRTARIPINVGESDARGGGFFVKSVVPSPARQEIGLDLQLTGGESSKKVVEARSAPRELPPPENAASTTTKKVEEKRVRTIIYEQPIVVQRPRKVLREVQEPKPEKKVRVKKIKKTTIKKQARERAREPTPEPIPEPVQAPPKVRQALQALPDVVDKHIEIKEVRNEVPLEIPILEVQKTLPIQLPEKREEYVKEIKINTTVQQEPQAYDEVDDSSYITSQIFIERLMRGAPAGSLQQKVNVEREEEMIVGPLSQYEVEQMYAQSMINVDTVSEKVNLTLSNGVANLIVKVRNEKIVPIRGSNDHFKKSAVIVTRLIDVDLNVTPDRREIQQQIMENQTKGRLDNRYTFELYKAFLALADADSGYSGQVPQQMVIEKKVEEQNLWDLRRQGKLSTIEDQADALYFGTEDSDQNLRNLVASSRGFSDDKEWDPSNSWVRTPRNTVSFQQGVQNNQDAYGANFASSQWQASKFGTTGDGSMARNNAMQSNNGRTTDLGGNQQWSYRTEHQWRTGGGGGGANNGSGAQWMANMNLPVANNTTTTYGGKTTKSRNTYLDMELDKYSRYNVGASSRFEGSRGTDQVDASFGQSQFNRSNDVSSRQVYTEAYATRQQPDAFSNLEEFYNSGKKSSKENNYLILVEEPVEKDLLVRRFNVRNTGDVDTFKMYESLSKRASETPYQIIYSQSARTPSSKVVEAPTHRATTYEVRKSNYSNAYVPRNPV